MRIFPEHLKQHMLLLATVAIATLGSVITGAAGLQVRLPACMPDSCMPAAAARVTHESTTLMFLYWFNSFHCQMSSVCVTVYACVIVRVRE
jgi:hypothetical protein